MPEKQYLEELIYNHFKEGKIIWYEYIDYIKTNNGVYRKGLKYEKIRGRYEFYIVSEDGEEILLDILQNNDITQFNNIIKAFKQ